MAVGRAGAVLLALGGALIAAGGVTATVLARDSAGVVTQELPLSPQMQKVVESPATFEEYLRSHPPKALMGEIHGGGR